MAWTANALEDPNFDSAEHPPPTEAELRGVVDELYDEWIDPMLDEPDQVHTWAATRFRLRVQEVTPDELKGAVDRRIRQLKLVFDRVAACELRDDGEVRDKIGHIAKVILEARNSLRNAAILWSQIKEDTVGALADEWNFESFFNWIDEDDKATSFQKVLLYVLKQLALKQYRRFTDQCFEQVMIHRPGHPPEKSHAWVFQEEIKTFIARTVQKEIAYNEWKHLTNPPDNAEKVVKNLMNQDHMEFRELKMNRFLWAYDNGLYNVREDMFWPFRTLLLSDASQITREAVLALPLEEVDADDYVPERADFVIDGVEVWNSEPASHWRLLPDVDTTDARDVSDTGGLQAALSRVAFGHVNEITSLSLAEGRLGSVVAAEDAARHTYRTVLTQPDRGGLDEPVILASGSADELTAETIIGLMLNDDIVYRHNLLGVSITKGTDGAMAFVFEQPPPIDLRIAAGTRVRLADGRCFTPVSVPLSTETVFRADGQFRANLKRRDVWPDLAARMTAFRRGVHLLTLSDVTDAAVSALPVDATLRRDAHTATASADGAVLVWGLSRNGADLTPNAVFYLRSKHTYHRNANGQPVWPGKSSREQYQTSPPTAEDVAVKFFNTEFRFSITPEAEAAFDPKAVVMPEFDRIVTAQGLSEDSQTWLMVMLARLFFPVGYDKWQVALFIKGRAGSGKSTFAQIIRSFYPEKAISTLTANIERQFGLEGIYQGLICICAEVREKFQLDQGDFQSAVSGEEVQIARKNQTPLPHKWDTPFFLLGNEVFDYSNNSGSIERRIFMFEFNKKVVQSDPKLLEKFIKNIDLFHRKAVALYHAILREHGDKDIWEPGVVGPEIMQWKNSVRKSTDGLYSFLKDENVITLHGDFYMPQDDLKKLYRTWRMDNNWKPQQWTADHYRPTFEDLGLHIVPQMEERDYHGTTLKCVFVNGVDAANVAPM